MEIILLAVTIGALLVAFIIGATAWRISREERARSAARVAALAAAAAAPELPTSLREIRAAEPATFTSPPPGGAADSAVLPLEPRTLSAPTRVTTFTPPRAAAAASAPRVPDLALDPSQYEPPLTATAAPIPDAFLRGEERGPSEGRQRGLAVAAAILFVVLGSAGYWLIPGGRAASQDATAASAPSNAPLELMSLRHERLGSRLSLSGLVRNPSAGAPVENLSAVVFLFDAQGAFLTSARTTVDFKRLSPGDESPFVIAMDAPTNVARYRVSFRTDAGILAHVDRRSEQPASTAIAATKS